MEINEFEKMLSVMRHTIGFENVKLLGNGYARKFKYYRNYFHGNDYYMEKAVCYGLCDKRESLHGELGHPIYSLNKKGFEFLGKIYCCTFCERN